MHVRCKFSGWSLILISIPKWTFAAQPRVAHQLKVDEAYIKVRCGPFVPGNDFFSTLHESWFLYFSQVEVRSAMVPIGRCLCNL